VFAETIKGDIKVEANPVGVAVNSNTNRIYVTNNQSDNVSVIDSVMGKVTASIQIGKEPFGIDLNSKTNKIYAIHVDNLSVINGESNLVEKTINTGGDGAAVAVNPDTNRVYTTSEPTNTLSVIDGNTDTLINQIFIPDGAVQLAVNPNTNHIFVAGSSDTVSVIDGNTNQIIKTYTLSGNQIIDVAVNSGTNKVFIATNKIKKTNRNIRNSFIVQINDSLTLEDKTNIKFSVPGLPTAISINSVLNKVYITTINSTLGDVPVLYVADTETLRIIDFLVLNNLPTDIVSDPVNNKTYIAQILNENLAGDLTVIDSKVNDARSYMANKNNLISRLQETINEISNAKNILTSSNNIDAIDKKITVALFNMGNASQLKSKIKCVNNIIRGYNKLGKAIEEIDNLRCVGSELIPGCISEEDVQGYITSTLFPVIKIGVLLLMDDNSNGISSVCEN
jgi:YVTN family beta-propeller protein